ncbi:MAG TPA: KH domain-containing protein [Armatimonadota bacterium]|jgi:hypothetical protein
MEELVRYLVSLLVDQPDQIEIEPKTVGVTKVYQVYVASGELGKVIGRRGRTANALRSVVEAAGRKRGEKSTVDIVS